MAGTAKPGWRGNRGGGPVIWPFPEFTRTCRELVIGAALRTNTALMDDEQLGNVRIQDDILYYLLAP